MCEIGLYAITLVYCFQQVSRFENSINNNYYQEVDVEGDCSSLNQQQGQPKLLVADRSCGLVSIFLVMSGLHKIHFSTAYHS